MKQRIERNSKRYFSSFLLLVILCISVVEGVDRARFQKCDQSGFCKRNRDYATQIYKESPYEIVESTITLSKGRFTADILNRENNQKFFIVITHYENGIIRVKINEKSPLSARYEVPDVLMDTIKRIPITEEEEFEDILFDQVKIQHSPFKIEFYSEDGEHVLTASERGLFNIEHLRDKKLNNENEEDESNFKRMKKESEWKEDFSSHSDSKPRGPTSVSMDFSFIGAKAVYGIPEHASSFALETTVEVGVDPYRLYNLDVFEYRLDSTMALYGSIPFMMSQRQGKSTAVFWLNSSETWIDVDNSPLDPPHERIDTHWFSESGVVDFFVLFGPTPKQIFYQYKYLTGFTPIPPLFSLAYHQCRWNYRDQNDVATVNDQFNRHDLPLDVIWLDIEHTDQKKYFTWDQTKFSDPISMVNNVAKDGRKMVTIIDPHIKKDDHYHIYSEGKQLNYFVKKEDAKTTYEGWCWPGASMYLDFSNPHVRLWWSNQFEFNKYIGSNENLFVWNDMNEPSVFNGPEMTMYKDLIHYGNIEHRDIHNLWGLWVHKATSDGLIQRMDDQNQRPFVLSRSFYAGSHRYGAIWTGDNKADWDHLKATIPMLLSINIAGISFSGADVGGFFGDTDPILLIRWYQVGAYQPFFRAHAHIDTKRREPYIFDDVTLSIIRNSIRARYALLPYWYTQFYFDSVHGLPVMRPLWVEYPNDESLYRVEDSYMIGSDLYVKPILEANINTIIVSFPGDSHQRWFDVDDYHQYFGGASEKMFTSISKIPVFQRGGSIIPRKNRARRSSSTMQFDPYSLYVALDHSLSAHGELYVDDGQSFDYSRGDYTLKSFSFANYTLTSRNFHSGYHVGVSIERIVVVGLNDVEKNDRLKELKKVILVDLNENVRMNLAFFLQNNEDDSDPFNDILVVKKPTPSLSMIDSDHWRIELEF